MGAHLGMWRFILSHFPTFLGAWNVTHGLPSWLAPLQALTLVMSPRLGLWHNLTPTTFFYHNSCFVFPTKTLNVCNSHVNATPKVGVHLGVIRLQPLHFPSFLKICFTSKHILGLMGLRTSHLVVNPMLRLQQAWITSPTPWALQAFVLFHLHATMPICCFCKHYCCYYCYENYWQVTGHGYYSLHTLIAKSSSYYGIRKGRRNKKMGDDVDGSPSNLTTY